MALGWKFGGNFQNISKKGKPPLFLNFAALVFQKTVVLVSSLNITLFFYFFENQLDLDYAPREASPLEKFEYNETEIHEDGRDVSTETNEEDESVSKEELNENEKETNGKKLSEMRKEHD